MCIINIRMWTPYHLSSKRSPKPQHGARGIRSLPSFDGRWSPLCPYRAHLRSFHRQLFLSPRHTFLGHSGQIATHFLVLILNEISSGWPSLTSWAGGSPPSPAPSVACLHLSLIICECHSSTATCKRHRGCGFFAYQCMYVYMSSIQSYDCPMETLKKYILIT